MVSIRRQHHVLVRLAHWSTVPLLAGLVLSGLSIYWAAPVFQHPRDPVYQSRDYLADLAADHHAGKRRRRLLAPARRDRA